MTKKMIKKMTKKMIKQMLRVRPWGVQYLYAKIMQPPPPALFNFFLHQILMQGAAEQGRYGAEIFGVRVSQKSWRISISISENLYPHSSNMLNFG